jgi:hypothetical protein
MALFSASKTARSARLAINLKGFVASLSGFTRVHLKYVSTQLLERSLTIHSKTLRLFVLQNSLQDNCDNLMILKRI